MKLAITIFLAGLLCLGGCTTYTSNCQLDYLRIQFVGFDSTEMATVILKSYFPGTTIPARDSEVIRYAEYPNSYSFSGDTANIPVYISADTLDKELIIPAISRSVKFSGIISDPSSSYRTRVPAFVSVKMTECYRLIRSCQMDDSMISVMYAQGKQMPTTIHR